MQIPKNHFKRRLLAGDTQYGLWLGLADSYCAEIGAGAGFDWVLIDAEHGPNDLRSILAQLQAIAPYDSSAIVRPVNQDPALIKQLLDVGAQTLLVPMVDTAEQAQAVVEAMHYPPRGIRGVGSALARAARWNGVEGYLHRASEELCLICQIESVTALENIEAICAVEGVDALFIGPSDLAASMGHIGNAGHPEVRAALEDAIARVRAAGKPVGLFSLGAENCRYYAAQGASFLAAGVDTLLYRNAATALIDAIRQGQPTEEAGSTSPGY